MGSCSLEVSSRFYERYQGSALVGGAAIAAVAVGLYLFKGSKKQVEEKQQTRTCTEVDGNVLNYQLPFVKKSTEITAFRGMPDGFNWSSLKKIWSLYWEIIRHIEKKTINFLNARTQDLDFNQTGFTLVPFKEEFDMAEWEKEENQEIFKKQVEPIILKLFPDAEIVQWTGFLFRGGEGQNSPAVDAPHLDAYPDWKKAKEFNNYDDYGKVFKEELNNPDGEMQKKMEKWKEFEKLDKNELYYIGFWKPIQMANPVLDFPLALMDASTFDTKDDCCPQEVEMSHMDNGKRVSFKNLNGAIKYSEKQRWYYYPEMTNEELLVFTHLAANASHANPHTSFRHPSAPTDASTFQKRQSMETRCYIRVPKTEFE